MSKDVFLNLFSLFLDDYMILNIEIGSNSLKIFLNNLKTDCTHEGRTSIIFAILAPTGSLSRNMKSNPQIFHLSTLHRGKYMLILLVSIFVIGVGMSKVPIQEILKIIIALLMVPLALYLAIKSSTWSTTWVLDDNTLQISNAKKTIVFSLNHISHIRNLKRSGGNLIIINQNKGPAFRTWRNKLFQKEDDLPLLTEALKAANIEYYDM